VADEELHSGGSRSEALEDIDLRVDEGDSNESGDKDTGETSAEKRLRLAKLRIYQGGPQCVSFPGSYSPDIYLSTFSADGKVDAAEIDKELISARLKQDVLEHAGKLHLFVADSVSTFS